MNITDQEFEYQILKHLVSDSNFYAKVYPILKDNYFENEEVKYLVKQIKSYTGEYSKQPDFKSLIVYLKNKKIPDSLNIKNVLVSIKDIDIIDSEVLVKETEKFIKKQEVTEAILDSAEMIEKNKVDEFDKIVGRMEEALKVSVDNDFGLDYQNSIEERYEYYTKRNYGYSTGIPSLDKMLGGGFQRKRLSLFSSQSHGGKSKTLMYLAANYISKGYNVIYITLEMPEEEIAKAIDANLLDMPANEIRNLSLEEFKQRVPKDTGKLRIKEYPSGVFSVIQLKNLLQELNMKEGFDPDVVIIDYLGIMSSSRVSLGKAGSYLFYKSIAEELHGFSKEYDKVVLSAVQLNRSAVNNTEVDESVIAESHGLMMTADVLLMIINTEDLRKENKVILKCVKNRQTGFLDKILLNVDFSKTMFWDAEEQNNPPVNIVKTNNSFTPQPKEKKEVKLKIEDSSSNTEDDLFDLL